jgi:Nif11 domain
MDLADVERFFETLKDDPGLAAELRASSAEAIVQTAARRGYTLAVAEAEIIVRRIAPAPGTELSDSQLDHVTGGWSAFKEG